MVKKYFRRGLYTLGILGLLVLLGNFGLNYWLKNKLPEFLKNNSDYSITYKTLDIELGSGNITATGLSISSKNPNQSDKFGIDGNLEALEISRLGIYDAIFKKRINTSDLKLAKPNLKITLPKPLVDKKDDKERSPIVFENLHIIGGNITVLRHTKGTILSVNNLNLNVTDLQLVEKSEERKLPIIFDEYHVEGENFMFCPDSLYIVKANSITTKKGLLNIKNFQLVPQLTFEEFRKSYPNKKQLVDFKADELDFQDAFLRKENVSVSGLNFKNPELKVFTTDAPPSQNERKNVDVILDSVNLVNAKIEISKPDKSRLFYGENLNLNIQKFLMNEETSKSTVPFTYGNFSINGSNLNYVTQNQDIKIKKLNVNPKSIGAQDIFVKPSVSFSKKPLLDVSLKRLNANVNSWSLQNDKLQLDVQNIVLDAMNGRFKAPENKTRKQFSLSKIALPIKVRNLTLKNSNIYVDQPEQPLIFNNLFANVSNLEINNESIKKSIPLQIGAYSLTTKNFSYRTKYYTLSAGLIKFQKNNFLINSFAMKPNLSRDAFIRSIPTEKDLYNIKVNQISGNGSWELAGQKKFMSISNILIDGVNANVFRSKIPKDDNTIKSMHSELLRRIKFPVVVNNLDIKNSNLVYEEDTKESDGPGKLIFGRLNVNAKNINSNKTPGKPTLVPISINCRFMDKSPLNLKWSFDTASLSDNFAINGSITELPASSINPFIEPYLNIRASGTIQSMLFNFKGNKSILNGTMNMQHKDLRVSIFKKGTKITDKVLSSIANIFVLTNTKFPQSAIVDNVRRDPSKSFFNFFWQGIQEGLKKTLIGKNAEKTEQSIRNTVNNTKTALKENEKDLKKVKKEINKEIDKTKDKIHKTSDSIKVKSQKTKGFIRKVLKKKEKSS